METYRVSIFVDIFIEFVVFCRGFSSRLCVRIHTKSIDIKVARMSKRSALIYSIAFVGIIVVSMFYKFFAVGDIRLPIIGEITMKDDRLDRIIHASDTANVTSTVNATTETVATSVTSSTIVIYLAGAIDSPGVYEVNRYIRLYEVIELAGGLTSEARADRINMVYQLTEDMSIYIPYVSDEALVGEDGFLSANGDTGIIISDGQDNDAGSERALVNINTASIDELDSLPGIGPAMAERIIDYRTTNGNFNSIEDIMNVSGIGETKFNEISSLICV